VLGTFTQVADAIQFTEFCFLPKLDCGAEKAAILGLLSATNAVLGPEQLTPGAKVLETLKLQKGLRGALEKGFLHWVESRVATSGTVLIPESLILRQMQLPLSSGHQHTFTSRTD
jgi:hypothetical protein